MLDTQYFVETPEGVSVGLNLAGPYARIWAFLIDLLIRSVVYAVIWAGATFLMASSMSKLTIGMLSIITFLIEWFFPVYFEMTTDGQTPGKKTLGLRVVHIDGTPINLSSSIIRNFLRVADFLPFLWLMGLFVMSAHPRFQRLGDLAAGTVVVHTRKKIIANTSEDAPPLPPPIALTSEEQRGICAFAERSKQFSHARRIELAEHASTLSHAENEEAVTLLKRYAAWIEGGRG